MATIRTDLTWSRLFQCYWEHTDTWIAFAQHLSKPDDLRLMRRFLRETWDPRYSAITALGTALAGRTPDQRLALIRQFGSDLLRARLVAEQMNLPLPDLSERDAGWQYAAVVHDPDLQIADS